MKSRNFKRALLKPLYWLRLKRKDNFNEWLIKKGFITLIDFEVINPKSYINLIKKYPKITHLRKPFINIDNNGEYNGKSIFYWYEEKHKNEKGA